jgi:hypothetical protein
MVKIQRFTPLPPVDDSTRTPDTRPRKRHREGRSRRRDSDQASFA